MADKESESVYMSALAALAYRQRYGLLAVALMPTGQWLWCWYRWRWEVEAAVLVMMVAAVVVMKLIVVVVSVKQAEIPL